MSSVARRADTPRRSAAGDIGYTDVSGSLGADPPNGGWYGWRERVERATRPDDRADLIPWSLSGAERETVAAWLAESCPYWPQSRYTAYLFELDAWTEYWDVYHPETHGRYHFGDGTRPGYLSAFLPSPTRLRVPVFEAWKAHALSSRDGSDPEQARARFLAEAAQPEVVEAASAVDELVRRLVREHFGGSDGQLEVEPYLDAIERFARDTLPECPERYERIRPDDARKPHARRHFMAGDIMWFAWAVHLECAQLADVGSAADQAARALLMAGVAFGASIDFAFTGRCRTRSEYAAADAEAWARIWTAARECAADFERAAAETRTLFFIRSFGDT